MAKGKVIKMERALRPLAQKYRDRIGTSKQLPGDERRYLQLVCRIAANLSKKKCQEKVKAVM